MSEIIQRCGLSVDECAKTLGIGRDEVLKAMEYKADNLPHLRVVYFGDKIVIPMFSIDDYLRKKLTRYRG